MKPLAILWKFSRPHTITGSVISIYTLFVLICGYHTSSCLTYLLLALLIGITCNIFIVGINQIADVPIDRINKPYLPIPAGELSIQQARVIVFSSLCISLGVSLLVSPYLFIIIVLATSIGWAYSMPPFYLKQHHLTAALAITFVRAILLNAGGFLVFNYLIHHSLDMPKNVKLLTLFVLTFSIVIAWFKDLPDIEGDRKYNIKTFAILYSPKTALLLGHLLVGAAYLFTIGINTADYILSDRPSSEIQVLFYGHIMLFALFMLNAFSIRLTEHRSIQKFYMRFWWFFFAEYLLYLIAYI